jgi:hypothetical protein
MKNRQPITRVLLALLFLGTFFIPTTVPAQFQDGDLVPDGVLNAADLLAMTRIVEGVVTPTPDDLQHGDLYPPGTGDGVINISDLLQLLNHVQATPPLAVDDPDAAFTPADTTVTTANVLANDILANNARITAFDSTSANSTATNVVYNNNGTFDYTPPAGFGGPDTFTYTLTDDLAQTSTATVTVTVNRLPVANPDSFAVAENGTASGNVMLDNGNGADNPGDTPTTVAQGSINVSNGSLTLNTDGSFLYTPNPDFSGTDSFSYTLTDSTPDTSNEATVTITVIPNLSVMTTQAPVQPDVTDGTSYELGMKFQTSSAGYIKAIRYYKAPSETGTHQGNIWSSTGTLLASVDFTNETASGWQVQPLVTPLFIQPGTVYVVSVNANIHYAATVSGLATSIVNGNISSVADGSNGVYGNPGSFPTLSYQDTNYFRDVVFFAGPDTTKLSGDNQSSEVSTTLPQPLVVQVRNSSGNLVAGTPVSFLVTSGGGTVSPADTVTDANGQASTMLTLGSTAGVNTVRTASPSSNSVDFTATAYPPILPAVAMSMSPQTLSTNTYNTVQLHATLLDSTGNTAWAATNPVLFTTTGNISGVFSPSDTVTPDTGVASVSFTPTSAGTGTIVASANGIPSVSADITVDPQPNQSVFTTQTPVLPSASDNAANYELGMKFQTARGGYITAIRYWKSPSDNGSHTGNIWSNTGVNLVSVPFVGESQQSGWHEQLLDKPLAILPNTTYTVSVNANNNYPFTFGGLAQSIVNGDLSTVADGNNGVYGAPGAFPLGSYENSNYFRDVVFQAGPTIHGISGDFQSAPVGSTLAQSLVVEVRNIDGTVNQGTTVSFTVTDGNGTLSNTSAVTDINGQASTQLTIGTTAGINTVRASTPVTKSFNFTATGLVPADSGSRLELVPADVSTAVNTPITYDARILDSYGNVVPTSQTVDFSVQGITGTFSPAASVTSVNGIAEVTFTALTSGTAVVGAASGSLTGATANLSVSDPNLAIVSGNNQSATVDTVLPQPFVVRLTDNTTGNPIVGENVAFTITGGNGSLSATSVPTDSQGYASTTLRLGTTAGTNTVTATVANTAGVVFTATGNPGPAVKLGLEPATATIKVNTPVNYTATVLDAFNNAITTATDPIDFTVTGVSGTFNPTPPLTPSNGTASSSFTPVTYGTATVTATTTGLTSAQASLDVTFGSISKVSGDNQEGDPGTTLAQPLVIKVLDDSGQPAVGINVTFSVTDGNGSVQPITASTGSTGLASTNFTLGTAPRLQKVTATAENVGSVQFSALIPNAVTLENRNTGTTDWKLTNPVSDTAPEIEGYAGATSVNQGGILPLKISLAHTGTYHIDVYRLGYYGGTGGRLMASVGPLSGDKQPDCVVTDTVTHLIECNWATSYELQVGTNWTSGLYIATLTDDSSGKRSQIWFVVRNDNSTSDLLFQSSFTTFEAYNNFGTNEQHSLYTYNSTGGVAAQKVSFDRPFGAVTIDQTNYNNIINYEYNMARWLESQGYDVTYVSDMDVHSNPNLLQMHKTYLSVGHDEYWSKEIRDNVEQARDSGVNLAFFSGNTAYWRVRFEPSSTGEPNRVMVCYKDPSLNDPVAPTYLWRGPENNRPENALLGVMYIGDDSYDKYGGYDHVVTNSSDPYYNSTGLNDGDSLYKLVGYEWDGVVNNGFSPPGLVILSQSPVVPTETAPLLPSGTDTTISSSVRYTAASGAKVFSTGSIQWMWGLDSDGVYDPRSDIRAQQFVVNVLSDMGATPATPDPGLVVP